MKRIVGMLMQMSSFFGRMPSMGYAIAYLFCIPMFAIGYRIMPQPSFYHGTVQHELALRADAHDIEKELLKEIVFEFQNVHGGSTANDGSWSIEIPKIHVYSLTPTTEKAELKIKVELVGIDENEGIQSIIPMHASIEYPRNYASYSSERQKWTVYKKLNIQNRTHLEINPFVIFPGRIGSGLDIKRSIDSPVFIPISSELQDQIFALGMAAKGLPFLSSGSFARMFYFSAVTITTLGYGDIVPITNIARIATSIESILGVILIGLFFNSLASQVAHSEPSVN
jgi:hypothetical protein